MIYSDACVIGGDSAWHSISAKVKPTRSLMSAHLFTISGRANSGKIRQPVKSYMADFFWL